MAKLTDDEIAAMLLSGVRQSVGFSDSRLSSERQQTMQYYNGEAPGKLHQGNSSYVSLDVYDSHESLKSQLVETFSGSLQPVTFTPMGQDDVELSRTATDMTSYVIFHQNDGFGIMRDIIDDALLGRNGIAKVWWEERHEDETYEMSNATLQALQSHLAQNPDHQVKDIELSDDETMVHRATLTLTKDTSQVKIVPLPPEEFFIAPRSVNLDTTPLCGHRYKRSFSDLMADGYDKKVLLDLADNDSIWLSTEPELIERHQQTDDIMSDRLLQWDQDSAKVAVVYECYCMMDPDDTGRQRLYQVVLVGDKVLSKQPVQRRPFCVFTPLPRPHAFWGSSFDKLVIPLQNARTYLTRAIIDHAMITTNPRYGVVQNAVKNPRELMENRIGGIVNVTRPDGIFPLPQSALNPFVFQTIGMLDDDKEQRTGVSRLSQGLNKDAVSKQNSADMVDNLVNLSQVRQKVIARNFAEGFLRDLYLMVYSLIVENEKQEKCIEVAGAWTPVDPTNWPARDKLTCIFTLGHGEKDQEVKKLMNVDGYLSKDPGLAHLYTPSNRYNVLKQALEASGLRNVVGIIGTPEQAAQPVPPNPMQQAELAVKQADAAVKQANAQAAVEKLKLDQQKAQQHYELEMMKLKLEAMREANQVQHTKDALAHKVAVDAFELQLQQKAADADKLSTFAEPTKQ